MIKENIYAKFYITVNYRLCTRWSILVSESFVAQNRSLILFKFLYNFFTKEFFLKISRAKLCFKSWDKIWGSTFAYYLHPFSTLAGAYNCTQSQNQYFVPC